MGQHVRLAPIADIARYVNALMRSGAGREALA
jgi:hypothetical protein